jgi:hypothetical protein
MCDSAPQEMTYTAGIPKEYKAANAKVLAAMLSGMSSGATKYGGQLSAPQDQLSLQAANIMSQLMGNQSYNAYKRPVMSGGGGGIGTGSGGGSTGGGGGSRNPDPPPPGTYPPGYMDPSLPPGGGSDAGDPWAPPKGPGPCFVAGTAISLGDGAYRMIEEIAVGEEVLSWDDGELVKARVTEIFHHEPDEAPAILVVNDGIEVTPEHSFLVNGEWTPIGRARIGDMLTTEDGEEPVTALILTEGGVPTYNFHTDHVSHNYFADGVLAHNAIPKQPWGASQGSPQGYSTMASLLPYLQRMGQNR